LKPHHALIINIMYYETCNPILLNCIQTDIHFILVFIPTLYYKFLYSRLMDEILMVLHIGMHLVYLRTENHD